MTTVHRLAAASFVATVAAAALVATAALAPAIAAAHDHDDDRAPAWSRHEAPGRPAPWVERDGWRQEHGRWIRVEAREAERAEQIREARAELRGLERERWDVQARFPRQAWRLGRFDAEHAQRRAELERQLEWLTATTPPWLAHR
jgi:hypothetical protein